MADNELMLDVGQANEFKLACRRNGWTNADIKKLCEGDLLAQVLSVVRGIAEVQTIKHIIDLDSEPFVPDGWKVMEHRKGGKFEWNIAKVQLLHGGPNVSKCFSGEKLHAELANAPCFNANLLDYLLAYPMLIPEDWKEKVVYFWGTFYRDIDDNPKVRCLYCNKDGNQWKWFCGWFNFGLHSGSSPVILISGC